MHDGRRIAVVIPALDEEAALGGVLDGLPAFVDLAVVVDDGSRDGTAAEAGRRAARSPGRIEVIEHGRTRGVGAAIETGYRRALAAGADAVAVLGGDGQMDPAALPALLEAIGPGGADYAKGDRSLRTASPMPFVRRFGGLLLTALTRLATGIDDLRDAQNGYTAIRREALERLLPLGLYPGYGVPNDILIKLARLGCTVRNVPIPARYPPGGGSKLRIPAVAPRIALLLLRGLCSRFFLPPPSDGRPAAGPR